MKLVREVPNPVKLFVPVAWKSRYDSQVSRPYQYPVLQCENKIGRPGIGYKLQSEKARGPLCPYPYTIFVLSKLTYTVNKYY